MKLGIMQPYFLPYIGYFQLMNAVDQYVIYDNIQYTKKGWINRNRILVNGEDSYITIPLKNESDYLNINQRKLSETWPKERERLLNRIANTYRKTPYFATVYPIIERAISPVQIYLFNFLYNSLLPIREYLGITTPLIISSTIDIDHSLRAENKVLAICKNLKANTYINAIGGIELYNKEQFKTNNIDLHFIKSGRIIYKQFDNNFISSLSIIDIMMFNSKEEIVTMLSNYSLV